MVSTRSEKPIYAPPCLSEVFLWPSFAFKSFNVRLTDDVPFSSFQERSLTRFPFLPYAIYGMMSLALCPQVVSQAPPHLRLSETQTAFDACFAASPSAVALTLECPVQYTKESGRRWTSNVATCQCELPIPHYSFYLDSAVSLL